MRYLLLVLICYFVALSNVMALKPGGVVLNPINGATSVPIQPTISIQSSSWATGVQILIAKDSLFSSIVLEDSTDYFTEYFIDIVNKGLSFKTQYFVKFRYFDSIDVSEWSPIVKFKTINYPTFLTPIDSSIVNIVPKFSWIGNSYDMNIQIVLADSGFSSTSINEYFYKGSKGKRGLDSILSVLNIYLQPNNTYKCRIRQFDSVYGNSDWSSILTLFVTSSNINPTPPIINNLEGPYNIVDYLNDNELIPVDGKRDFKNKEMYGSIDGSFVVTPSGAATFTIPIWCPPGINGMQPNISLTYNSQSNAKIAGNGWSINGLSEISRQPKNKFLDGETSELNVDSYLYDFLALDGNRLIVENGSYGENQCVYSTQKDNNSRIKQNGSNLSSPNSVWFELFEKNGGRMIYGESQDSKYSLKDMRTDYNQKRNLSWKLNKVYDVFGNYIEYEYEKDWNGLHLPKRIKYTMHSTSPNPIAEIEFVYAQKAVFNEITNEYKPLDQTEYYNNAVLSIDNTVLTEIIVKYENIVIRKYKLDYYYNGITQLKQISEIAFDGIKEYKKEETVFNYNEVNNIILNDDLTCGNTDPSYTYHFGDFNGDGIKDRLILDRDEVTSNGPNRAVGYLQWGKFKEPYDGKIEFVNASNVPLLDIPDYLNEYYRLDDNNIRIADLNKDGKDDIFFLFLDGKNSKLKEITGDNSISFRYLGLQIYKGTNNGLSLAADHFRFFDRKPYDPQGFSPCSFNEKVLLADYDNDGNCELVWQSNYVITPVKGKKKYSTYLHVYYYEIIDSDGNFIFTKNSSNVPKNVFWGGSGSLSSSIKHDECNFTLVETELNSTPELLCTSKNADEQGIYTLSFISENNPFYLGKRISLSGLPEKDFITLDFNGDGYTDLLYRNQSNCNWYIQYWEGKQYSIPIHVGELATYDYLSTAQSPFEHRLFFGDYNSDGKTDILRYQYIDNSREADEQNPKVDDWNVSYDIIYLSQFGNNNKSINIYKGKYYYQQFEFSAVSDITPGVEKMRLGYNSFYYNNADDDEYRQLVYPISTDINGLGDVEIIYHSYNSSYSIFYINPEATTTQHNIAGLLNTICNGFNNLIKINYAKISEPFKTKTGLPLGKQSSNSGSDLIPYNNGIIVVRDVDNIMAGTNSSQSSKTEYAYGEVLYHKDAGFLGFSEFTTIDYDFNGNSTTKQYYGILSNNSPKIYTTYLHKEEVKRGYGYKAEKTILVKELSSKIINFGTNRFAIFPETSNSINYIQGSKESIVNSYDQFGNLYKTISTIFDMSDNIIQENTQENTYQYIGDQFSILKIPNKVVFCKNNTKIFNNGIPELPFITETEMEYWDETRKYALKRITKEPNNPKKLSNLFDYDIYGNVVSKKQSINNLDERETCYEYSDKRFANKIISKSIVAGNTYVLGEINKIIDGKFGVTNSETDMQGNFLTNAYDAYGNLKKSTDKYGNYVEYFKQYWQEALSNSQTLFKLTKTYSYGPDTWEYYDGFGNILSSEKEVFGRNDLIKVNHIYSEEGLLLESTYPFFKSSNQNSRKIEKIYDELLRVKTIKDNGEFINYNYKLENNLFTIQSPNYYNFSSMTKNAAGIVVKTEDDGHNVINYKIKSDLKSKTISTVVLDNNSSNVEVEYDVFGNKIRVVDPDAGICSYQYNGFGELIAETNQNGSKIIKYDYFGRIDEINSSEGKIKYKYVENGNGKGNVESISGPEYNDAIYFTYNGLNQLILKRIIIDSKEYSYTYSYNSNGALDTKTMPTGVKLKYHYDDKGFNYKIDRIDLTPNVVVWERLVEDEFGVITKYQMGGDKGIKSEIIFDEHRLPDKIISSSDGKIGDIQNWDLDFDYNTKNLMKRKDVISGQAELFSYDEFHRLTQVKDADYLSKLSMTYYKDGAIKSKQDVGDYLYSVDPSTPEKPYHAVKNINNAVAGMEPHEITLTSFNSVKTITQCSKRTEFDYGADNQRNTMRVFENSELLYTKYYLDEFEIIEKPDGFVKKITYISSPNGIIACDVIEEKYQQQISREYYYIHADYLGSVEALSDKNCKIIADARFSYNAWGERRDPYNWDAKPSTISDIYFEILDRGFTGHEHLRIHELINMNGRVYDQTLGMFIQPDNYIQMQENSQSYNRYAYCLNNPLKFIDPSGEWFGWDDLVVGGAFFVYGYVSNGLQTGNWGWNSIGVGLLSAAQGYLSYNTLGYSGGTTTSQFANISTFLGVTAFNTTLSKVLPTIDFSVGEWNVSLSPSICTGSHGIGTGYNIGITYRHEFEDGNTFTFGFELNMMLNLKSVETGNSGSELTIGGGIGYGSKDFSLEFTSTHYFTTDVSSQHNGGIKISSGDCVLQWENDGQPFTNKTSDGGDRFRSAAASFSINDWSVGFNFFTGDPGLKYQDRTEIESSERYPNGYYNSGTSDDYRLGAVYIGYKNTRFGWNSEWLRHWGQNIIAHGLLGIAGFQELNVKFPDSPYYTSMTKKRYSLW